MQAMKGCKELEIWLQSLLSRHERAVVKFVPWALYPCRKSPQYILNRRMAGSQSWSRRIEEEMKIKAVGPPAHNAVTTPTTRFPSKMHAPFPKWFSSVHRVFQQLRLCLRANKLVPHILEMFCHCSVKYALRSRPSTNLSA